MLYHRISHQSYPSYIHVCMYMYVYIYIHISHLWGFPARHGGTPKSSIDTAALQALHHLLRQPLRRAAGGHGKASAGGSSVGKFHGKHGENGKMRGKWGKWWENGGNVGNMKEKMVEMEEKIGKMVEKIGKIAENMGKWENVGKT